AAQQVKEADQAIVQIVQSFGNVMTTVNEIAMATREQAEGISQVSLSLAEMDRATQQNAALVEQTAAAADALTERAATLTASVAVFTL
ncbi:methyl-accepting chemotaxis protein, partial [Salmonella enterica]